MDSTIVIRARLAIALVERMHPVNLPRSWPDTRAKNIPEQVSKWKSYNADAQNFKTDALIKSGPLALEISISRSQRATRFVRIGKNLSE